MTHAARRISIPHALAAGKARATNCSMIMEKLMNAYWTWKLNDGEYDACLELYDGTGAMLAFIREQPGYCDRGHYQVILGTGGPGPSPADQLHLDEADGRDLMCYMDLEVAMWETVEFLMWRMFKISHHQQKGGIRTWARENMPAGQLEITDVEHRSTRAPLPEEGQTHE